jgi:hypothetical protein
MLGADLWHFMPARYSDDLLCRRLLFFKNCAREKEATVLVDNGTHIDAGSVGYFSFTSDENCHHIDHFWNKYADFGTGISVGFAVSGWLQDSAPAATGDYAVAASTRGRAVGNLYVRLGALGATNELTSLRNAYRAPVYYATNRAHYTAESRQIGSPHFAPTLFVSMTLKPPMDAADSEERLLLLDCPQTTHLSFETAHPYLRLRAVVIGPKATPETRRHILGTCQPPLQVFSMHTGPGESPLTIARASVEP